MKDLDPYDVVIAGGGPAGIAALHWCLELGLNTVLLERDRELGGQLLKTYNPITNYPGVAAANGCELRDRFLATTKSSQAHRLTGIQIVETDLAKKTLVDAERKAYRGRTVIIATGVRRRELGTPGEREFRGRGVLESGARDRELVTGKHVVIVGGGDAAVENAISLSDLAEKVYVVHRRGRFSARDRFLDAAAGCPNVEFITDTRAVAIEGSSSVETVELEHSISGQRRTVAVDAVLIRIGVTPNTEMFCGQAKLDDAGYLIVDRYCATSKAGVFAVGDVSNRAAPTVSGAVGDGATAARAVFDLLSH